MVKMLKKMFFVAAFLFVAVPGAVAGEIPGSGWLEAGPGARAAAMGDAMTAAVDGPTATYWNPATTAINGGGAEVMHADWWVESSSIQHLAVTFPGELVDVGFSAHHVGVYGLDLRTGPSADPIDEFDSRSYSLGLSIARGFGDGWRVGATSRYLSEDIYVDHANGWSLDLGLLRSGLVSGALDLGLAVRHIGDIEGFASEGDPLPTTASAGVLWRPSLVRTVPTAFALDVVHVREYGLGVRTGIEATVFDMLALRGGWQLDDRSSSFSAGFGLRWKSWMFDLSLTPYEDDLGTTQRFSVRADW
jgi:hypothetical protein